MHMTPFSSLLKTENRLETEADFADRLMSALRFEFGGHLEQDEPMEGEEK